MAASDVVRLGVPCSDSAAGFYVLDSGATNLSTGASTTTITATATNNFDGTKPTIRAGWCMVEIAGVTTAAITQVDLTFDDGTVTVRAGSIPAAATNVAARGCNYLWPLFATLSDSMASTGIYDVNAIVATNVNPGAGTCRVYFFGSN